MTRAGYFYEDGQYRIYVKFGTMPLDVVQVHGNDLPMEIGKTVRIRHFLRPGSNWKEFTPDFKKPSVPDHWMWCGPVGETIGYYPHHPKKEAFT